MVFSQGLGFYPTVGTLMIVGCLYGLPLFESKCIGHFALAGLIVRPSQRTGLSVGSIVTLFIRRHFLAVKRIKGLPPSSLISPYFFSMGSLIRCYASLYSLFVESIVIAIVRLPSLFVERVINPITHFEFFSVCNAVSCLPSLSLFGIFKRQNKTPCLIKAQTVRVPGPLSHRGLWFIIPQGAIR